MLFQTQYFLKEPGQNSQMRNPIIIICILCLAIRLVFCYFVFPVVGIPIIESVDIDKYGPLAMNIVHGYGYVPEPGSAAELFRPPLYPFFLVPIYFIFGENLYIIQLVHSLLGALTCFIVYLIADKIFDRKTAILSAAIFTFYPLFIWYTARIWCETLLTFLVSISVLCLVNFFKTPSKTRALALGVSLGISSLCKSFLLLFPIFLLPVLALFLHRKKDVILNICLIILSVFLVIAPWTYRNYKVSGHFIPVQLFGIYVVAGDINIERGIGFKYRMPSLREAGEVYNAVVLSEESKTGKNLDLAEQEGAVRSYLFHKYLSSPSFFFKKVIIQAVQFWYVGGDKLHCLLFAIAQLTLLIPGLLGVIYAVRRKYLVAPLLCVIIYTMLVCATSAVNARYSVPIMPYVGIFAAYWIGTKLRF